MDLRNFEGTTTYAIEAVYRDLWNLIPERFRLKEMAQRNEDVTPTTKKSSALKYSDVEAKEYKAEERDFYSNYCEVLNTGKYIDLTPFYDPQMDFENRLHYKLVGIDYPDRQYPWFIITWNHGEGLLNSSISRRRFQSAADYDTTGKRIRFDFINAELNLTLAVYCNTMQGLLELQENIYAGKREKAVVETGLHSVLGHFPVSLDMINSSVQKLQRDKGTLCVLTLTYKIDYPVIVNVRSAETGIIEEIHLELDSKAYTGASSSLSIDDDITPDQHAVLSRDVIDENTPVQ